MDENSHPGTKPCPGPAVHQLCPVVMSLCIHCYHHVLGPTRFNKNGGVCPPTVSGGNGEQEARSRLKTCCMPFYPRSGGKGTPPRPHPPAFLYHDKSNLNKGTVFVIIIFVRPGSLEGREKWGRQVLGFCKTVWNIILVVTSISSRDVYQILNHGTSL